jgi:hypothetical protein
VTIFNSNTALKNTGLATTLNRAYLPGVSDVSGTVKELVTATNKAIILNGATLTTEPEGSCVSIASTADYAEIAESFDPPATGFSLVMTYKLLVTPPTADWAALNTLFVGASHDEWVYSLSSYPQGTTADTLDVGVEKFVDGQWVGARHLLGDAGQFMTAVITWAGDGTAPRLFVSGGAGPVVLNKTLTGQAAGAVTSLVIGDPVVSWPSKQYFFAYSDTVWTDADAQSVADDVAGQLFSAVVIFDDNTALQSTGLATTLNRAYLPGVSDVTGTVKELVTATNKTISLNGGATLTTEPEGSCVSIASTTQYAEIAESFNPPRTGFSLVMTYKLSVTPPATDWAALNTLFVGSTHSDWAYSISSFPEATTADTLDVGVEEFVDGQWVGARHLLGSAGEFMTAVITWAGDGTAPRLFVTGGAGATVLNTTLTGQAAGTITSLVIGDPGNSWPSKQYFFAYSDTVWSDTDAQAVADNVAAQLLTTTAVSSGGGTKLYLRTTTDNGLGFQDLIAAAGASNHSIVTSTTALATEIEVTEKVVEWISGRAPAGGFTLAGPITFNVWSAESDGTANTGLRARLFKKPKSGSEVELGGPYDMGQELAAGTSVLNSWTGTPPTTEFAEDDRLVLRIYVTNAGGDMGGGDFVTMDYDGSTSGADYDTWIQLSQFVTFKAPGDPDGTPTPPPPPTGPYDIPSSAVPTPTVLQGLGYQCSADYTFGTGAGSTINDYNKLIQYFSDQRLAGDGTFSLQRLNDEWQWGPRAFNSPETDAHNGDVILRELFTDHLTMRCVVDDRFGPVTYFRNGLQLTDTCTNCYNQRMTDAQASQQWGSWFDGNGDGSAEANEMGVRGQSLVCKKLQKGGYVEICAKMSPTFGAWIGPWIIDGDQPWEWPPEIDLNEEANVGEDPSDKNHVGLRLHPEHTTYLKVTRQDTDPRFFEFASTTFWDAQLDTSADFHVYGVKWVVQDGNPDGDYFEFYFDQQLMWKGTYTWWKADGVQGGHAVWQMQTAYGGQWVGNWFGGEKDANGNVTSMMPQTPLTNGPMEWSLKWIRFFDLSA